MEYNTATFTPCTSTSIEKILLCLKNNTKKLQEQTSQVAENTMCPDLKLQIST